MAIAWLTKASVVVMADVAITWLTKANVAAAWLAKVNVATAGLNKAYILYMCVALAYFC